MLRRLISVHVYVVGATHNFGMFHYINGHSVSISLVPRLPNLLNLLVPLFSMQH